ncbi:MAG: GPW/gp25 family protein, partial [Hydrogenophilus sp.]|nr:GPW/gp25 family protein [Hydrogenophilus sp.]
MGRAHGRKIGRIEPLRQSIIDILSTYTGERIMRPEYGSRIGDLIDRPVSDQWLADLYFEVAYAIQRWEPRVRLLKQKDFWTHAVVFISKDQNLNKAHVQ